jgi:hypothetical protein
MKDIGELLRETDLLGEDDALSVEEARVMRIAVVQAARGASSGSRRWPQPLAVGALVALMIATGVTTGTRMPARESAAPSAPVSQDRQPRQLQFATPGGTRIIWIFDPNFTLRETTP